MRSYARYWPIPLRLMLAVSFLFHGLPKIVSSQGHQGFVGMLQSIGVPAPNLMAWVVGLVEVLGAVALLVGAFVAIASALLIADMLVAMFKVHLPAGFNFFNVTGMGPDGPVFGMPGAEVPLLFIAGLLALAIGGAGPWSVEGMRTRRTAATT